MQHVLPTGTDPIPHPGLESVANRLAPGQPPRPPRVPLSAPLSPRVDKAGEQVQAEQHRRAGLRPMTQVVLPRSPRGLAPVMGFGGALPPPPP